MSGNTPDMTCIGWKNRTKERTIFTPSDDASFFHKLQIRQPAVKIHQASTPSRAEGRKKATIEWQRRERDGSLFLCRFIKLWAKYGDQKND